MFKLGQVVWSSRGHDQGSFYVVVGLEQARVYIADGKRRKLQAPKAKSPLHLRPTNTVIDLSSVSSDRRLRTLLREYHAESQPVPTEKAERRAP